MGTTPNRVYGLKLFPGLFDAVSPHLRLTEALPNLRFVRLRRRDVLGQAMSWMRSIQTAPFRSTETPRAEPRYDGDAIRSCVGQVCQRNARWDMYFARTGIEPVDLFYEDVARDPGAAVDAVAGTLRLTSRPVMDPRLVRLDIQRDARTTEWRERFHAEFGDRNSIDSVAWLTATM